MFSWPETEYQYCTKITERYCFERTPSLLAGEGEVAHSSERQYRVAPSRFRLLHIVRTALCIISSISITVSMQHWKVLNFIHPLH